MDFIDLAAQQRLIRRIIDSNIKAVLDHGQYIMGPEIAALEKTLGQYVGAKNAIACASGTDALLMALMAYGVGPGDAVFTTPFTFIATAEIISLLGATPVFIDIDPRTYNINPESLERGIAAMKKGNPRLCPLPRTALSSSLKARGIIAVDLFGLLADYENLDHIARQHGLFLIEDAAQSLGAEHNGRRACSFGDIACTSFFPAKPLGCYGDGGMCFCANDSLAEIMRSIRLHGKGHHKYDNIRIGINGRLDTLQAAILLAKFEIFPEEAELRDRIARRYSSLLASCTSLVVPDIPEGYKSIWAQYSLLARDEKHRDRIMASLQEAGIPTAIYYPKPLHLQEAFSRLGYSKGDFPVSEDCASRIFSLPMHPYLREDDQRRIVSALQAATS